jgi:hypothetical protein
MFNGSFANASLIGNSRTGDTGGGSSGSPRCTRIFRIGPGAVSKLINWFRNSKRPTANASTKSFLSFGTLSVLAQSPRNLFSDGNSDRMFRLLRRNVFSTVRRPYARRETRKAFVCVGPEQLAERIALAADVARTLGDATTISIDPSMIGPSPIVFEKSQIVGTAIDGFVVKSVNSGLVEKWNAASNTWEDVSTTPKSGSPRELLRLLNKRVIRQGELLRWRPQGSDGDKAFQVIGWDVSQDIPTIHPAAPARIPDVDVTPFGVGQASLSWAPPSSDEPTSYTVTKTTTSPDGTVSHETTLTSATLVNLNGLKADNSHMFSLTATNDAGTSLATFGAALGTAAPGEVKAPISTIKVVCNSSLLSSGEVFIQVGDSAPISQKFTAFGMFSSNPGPDPEFMLINPPHDEKITMWVRYYPVGGGYTDYYYDPYTSQSNTNGTCADLIGNKLPLLPGETVTVELDYEVFGWSGIVTLPDGRRAGCSFKTPAQQGDLWAITKGTFQVFAEMAVFAAASYYAPNIRFVPGASVANAFRNGERVIINTIARSTAEINTFGDVYNLYWRGLIDEQVARAQANKLADEYFFGDQEAFNEMLRDLTQKVKEQQNIREGNIHYIRK